MNLDTLLVGRTVVDGSGREGRVGSVSIAGDRIVYLSEDRKDDCSATWRIDVSGLFVDVHTHYDAQALFDPALRPSPLHGATTVFAGKCGSPSPRSGLTTTPTT
jgi:N-acyl-D-aspartate/D-glutamate deacylase